MEQGAVVIIGGTAGIGRELAATYAARGRAVVISGRDAARARSVAAEIGGNTRGIAFDLAEPETIPDALTDIGPVHRLAIAAIERDHNSIDDYNVAGARRLVVTKLVGYPMIVSTLRERLVEDASIVLFGGLAKQWPYPGSTTVSTINGGVSGLVRTLVKELAPIRVNAIHPGIVGDSPYWRDKPQEGFVAHTPIGRLVRMGEVVDATVFLLENGGINACDLFVDGGWMLK